MASDDLFAPPTKDELAMAKKTPAQDSDLFAPPTKDELELKKKKVANDFAKMKEESPYNNPHSPISAQTALDQLPVAGSILGGIGGTAAGSAIAPGPGSIAGEYVGAGIGGAAGEGLRYAGEKYLLGKDMSKEDLGKRLATSGAAGVIGQGAGNLVGAAGRSLAKSGVQDIAPTLAKPGAEQITKAAAALGVKPTAGMLTDDYTVRNLEDSLGQSPSIPGSLIRSEQKPVREAISKAAEDSVSGASAQSDYDAGRQLKKGVTENLQNRYTPIQEAYSDIENHTKDVPLNPQGLRRISNNIRNLEEAKFSGSDGHKVANKFANWLDEADNVNDIKLLKTKARQIAQDPTSSFEEKSVASSIMGKLDQAQTNSITRQAVKLARDAAPQVPVTDFKPAPDATEAFSFLKPAKEAANEESQSLAAGAADIAKNKELVQTAENQGRATGKQLVGKIKDTNAQYRGLMEDAKTFGQGTGLTKANKGMSATLEDINNAKPEDMAKAMYDMDNVDFRKFVKEKMPEQYELARQQRLAEIVKKTGGDSNKILKLADKMSPETRLDLFGKENVENLSNANTLLKAIPGKVGASDTPRGLDFHDLGLLQNARDAGRYGLLKGKASLPKAGLLLQKAKLPVQGLVNKGLIDDRQD